MRHLSEKSAGESHWYRSAILRNEIVSHDSLTINNNNNNNNVCTWNKNRVIST